MQIKKYKSLSTSRVNSRISSRLSRVGVFSLLGGLSVLAIVTICPVAPEEAQAATVSAGGSSLSVSVSNNTLALAADPTVNSGIALGSVTISAKTTNTTGYTMNLSTSGSTAMTSTDTKNTATIPTLASNTVLTNFPANRWGYYVGTSTGTTSSTYKPFSTTATEIDSTTVANSTVRTRNLTIATKINSALPASTYTAKLVVSVVGNALPTISDIANMQDMTSKICESTAESMESQLKDTRDGQLYWTGKMKDGRCWMLQNLALSLTTAGLKSSDTNIAVNWSSSSVLPPVDTVVGNSTGSTSVTAVQSWSNSKPQIVLATPLLMEACTASSFSGCHTVGFVDVTNTTNFQPTYTATIGNWAGANAANDTLVAVNCTTWSGTGTNKKCAAGTYDPHYLVGFFYSWSAATAGTGGAVTSGEASGSICPKGWKLPTSNSTATGSFAGLLSKYGVDSSLDNGTYNVAGSPLRFVRGGYVDPGTSISNAGYGFYSSSTPGGSGYAYILYLANSGVLYPSVYNIRYNGISVRCTAG